MLNCQFQLEMRLKKLDPELSLRYTSCMPVFKQMLKKFRTVFPNFTDHTLLHTMSVTNYANCLLGDGVRALNASEIYIFLMSSALHDVGMGISDRDFDAFVDELGLREYVNAHPELTHPTLTRKFHNDFSAAFVKKYWQLLDIPNAQYAGAIAQVSRGHRKVDLMDETEYPTSFMLDADKHANIAMLGALLRIADELDVASDRNPELLYQADETEEMSKKDIFEFAKHKAIRAATVTENAVVITAETDEPGIILGVTDVARTVEDTLQYCTAVIRERSDVPLADRTTRLILNHEERPL